MISIVTFIANQSIAATFYWNRNEYITTDRDFSKAYNWTASANGTGLLPASNLDDDFTSNTLGSAWTFFDKVSDGNSTHSLTSSADQLSLVGRGADIWLTNNGYVGAWRKDIHGNIDVTVKIISQTNTDAYAKAGILIANDITNLGDGGYFLVAMTPGHGVIFDADQAGTIGEFDYGVETASQSYPIWLRLVKNGLTVTGYYRTATSNSWTSVGSSTSQGTRLKSHVALVSSAHNTGTNCTTVFDDFTGGGTISVTGQDLSLNGSGSGADASATFGSNDLSVNTIDFTGYGGTLDMGGQNGLFATYYDNMDFTGTSYSRVDSLVSMDWGAASPGGGLAVDSWSARWEGYVVPRTTDTYTFYCKSDDGCRLWVNNTLLVDQWVGQGQTEVTGNPTLSLTAGTRYSIVAEMFDDGGNAFSQVKWSCSTIPKECIPKRDLYAAKLTVSGTGTCVNMSAGTITASDGWIDFSAPSGTQTFVPRSGQNMPNILHSGAGTLTLSTNALSTIGFFQGAGVLNLNGLNISTVASGTNRGDFHIWSGGPSTFSGLAGRTITVAGNASIAGSAGSLVNMNPGSNVNFNVTGRLTADYASISNNTSSISQGLAYKSVGTTGNNWVVNAGTFYWNRNEVFNTSTALNRIYNWTSNADGTGYRPEAPGSDKFESRTLSSNWFWKDLDADEAQGAYALSGGHLLLSGRGGDLYGATNQFVTLYRTDLTGDYLDITVKILSQNNSDAWGKAGIVMANNFSTLSSGGYAFIGITPGNNISFQADVNAPQGEIDGGGGGGTLAFPIWLRLIRNGTSVSGYWRTSQSSAWTQSNATVTIAGLTNGVNSQIGLFSCSHNAGTTMSVAFDDFEGAAYLSAGYVSATDNDFSFNGSGSGADANSSLIDNLSANSIVFTNYTGAFDFSTFNLTLTGGNATFVAGQGLTAASGSLTFTGTSGTQTLTPKSGATYNALVKSGAGTLAISTDDFVGGALTLSGGTLDIGAGRSHTFTSLATSGSSTLTFNGSALTLTTGNADLSGLGALNTSAGSAITFARNTAGTQVFTPKSGSTHPNITKAGATATLQLATNALTARSLAINAGTLDFAGLNVTINNSGNLSVTGGGPTTIANLGGSTLTVAGTTSLAGSLGSMLNINPGSTWALNSTGAVTGSYATVANSNATGSAAMAVATNCTNGGGNQNWNFPTTDFTAWNYSSQITFNTTATGANIASNLSNFPLLVRLDSNNFIFPQADPTGDDVRFGDPDGNGLSYEIERWDATLRKAEIWVMVPTIDGNSNRDYINMFWGNSAASAASSGSAVFNAGMNWVAAWHLKQNGSQPSFADASAAANTGTGQNGGAGDTVTANIGFGYRLNGTNRFLTSTNPYTNIATLSIGTWFRTTTSTGGKMLGFQTSQTGLAGQYDRHLWMDNTGKLNFAVYSGGNRVISSTSAYNDGAWHYAVARTSPLGLYLFVDGLPVASNVSYFSGENTTGYWRAGWGELAGWSPSPTSLYFSGQMDEITINHGELSADWIKFAYHNQKQNSAVLTFAGSALATWAYSSKVYINTSATGANITSDQTNYPLLVRLTPGNFEFTQAKGDGGDLRFTDSTGALLAYEIESYDATAKTAAIWVQIPSVKGKNNSQWFRMYWGKPGAISLSSSVSVFPAGSGNFAGVWHLNNNNDATSNGNNGVPHNGASPESGNNSATGLIGLTRNFVRSNSQWNIVPYSASLGLNTWTASAWAYLNTTADYMGIMGGRWPTDHETFGIKWGTAGLYGEIGNGTAWLTTTAHSTAQAPATGTWYYVTYTITTNAYSIYLNGSLAASGAFAGVPVAVNPAGNLGIGYSYSGEHLDGKLDEVRMDGVIRSADWIKLNYETQKAASSVVTLGPRSADFTKSVRFNFNTTSSGANVSGNVANVPILIRLNSSNFDFSVTTNAGTDLKFVDKDGSNLYHEVSEWDKANRVGKVWVKVPQVDGDSPLDFITLYYGCATCVANAYAVDDSVWSGYNAVYHLNGGMGDVKDASPYAATATRTADMATFAGLTTPLSPVMNGVTDQVNIPNSAQLDGETMTTGFWIKTTAVGINATWFNSTWLADRDATGSSNAGWAVVLANASGRIRFVAVDDELTSTADISNGAWRRVDLVKTPTHKYIYIDGVLDNSEADAGTVSNDENVHFGGENSNARFTAGQWNEFSFSASQRSADYIKLSYENQKEASTLFSTTTFSTASFQRTKVFRLNTTPSGANVSGDVFNFPLLLRIAGTGVGSATAVTDLAQSAGQDIRFLDGDGVTWLDYQIERWSASVDSGEVWVKVPRIRGNSSSDFITMYYQQASGVTVPDGQCGSCVFGTDNGFAGAWHLGEDGSNTSAAYKDASGNLSHGTGANMTNGSDVGAPSGLGSNFIAASNQLITAGSAGFHPDKEVSVEAWVNSTSQATYKRVLGRAFTSAADPWTEFDLESGGGSSTYDFALSINGANSSAATTTVTSNGTWYHIAGTYDGTTIKAYHNGVQEGSYAVTGTIGNYGRPVTIGGYEHGGSNFNGIIDEPRIALKARSADWIKLAYQNQRRDLAPLFNPTTADFQKSRRYTFNTTKTGANVMGDVSDFPLLVRVTDVDGGILDQVQGSGTSTPPDIRFLDGDGRTWLNYQVERWDRGVDSGEVWVRIPKVDGNSDHDFITMYYQQVSGITITEGQWANSVFDTTLGFASTWHLNNALTDATVNANTGTNTNSTDGEGVSASGRTFAGNGNINFGNGNSLKNISNAMTVEAWIKTSTSVGGSVVSVIRHDGHFTPMQYWAGTGNTAILRWSGGSYTGIYEPFNGVFDDNTWHHWVAQYDAVTGFKAWRDGVMHASDATITGALTTTTTSPFSVGSAEGAGEFWTGKLDEIRVSNVHRDSHYIKLSYQTQRRTGNLFWNTRVGPNNIVSLTALTVASGNIALAWNTPVSDSSNADSVGLWVKYSAFPDSANAPAASAGSATHVVNLAKTDSAYAYPATYPGTYWFALAVRNTSGKWSPFTTASSDTASLGTYFYPDTVYVDSAIGSDSYSCSQARSPATPKLTITSAVSTCTATDTLVVRVMPGTYANDNSFTKNAGAVKAHVMSFDNNSRAILNGSGNVTENSRTWNYTVALSSSVTLRQMDVRAASNGHIGVYVRSNSDSVTIDGNRIYGGGGNVYDTAISTSNTATEYLLIQNNIIYQPAVFGVEVQLDNRINILNNVFYGSGGSSKGVYMGLSAINEKLNINNNIFYNWNYGIHTLDANSEIGVVSNNLFFLVTTGQEVVGETNTAGLIKDPLFANTTIGNPHGFKLLPGSSAIDAGIATLTTGTGSYTSYAARDFWGATRILGSAMDIGPYEGTGYTPNPSGEFDTLIATSTSTTVTVYNSKWKVVFDKAKGGGISEFYDQSAPSTNLLYTGTVLFEDKVASTNASSQTTIAPALLEQTKARVVVKQRFAYSASLDVNFYYTLYPSGHIFVQVEYVNLSAGALSPGTLDYTLKVNNAVTVFNTKAKDGFAYLTTSTRDASLIATRPFDDGSQGAETWTGSSASGSAGNVVFNTAAMASMPRYYRRYHHMVIYIGDAALDFAKVSAIASDMSAPSALTASSGGLIHERSWQDRLGGHWTFDDGAGSVARDKSVYYANNGAITGAKFVSGKINAALNFTSSDVVVVADADVLEAAQNHTYMFWMKPSFTTMGSDAYILSKGQNSSDGWSFRRNTSASTLRFRMGTVTVDSPVLTDGVWSHIALVEDSAGILRLHVNGVLQAVSTSVASPAVNASTLRIGENDGATAANRYVGEIDDVRIYLANIPLGDIQSIYNRGFSQRYGCSVLRSDNNNRMVANINGSGPQTRAQPAFQIDNWSGPATPKFVYLNGVRLAPNTDFCSGIVSVGEMDQGFHLLIQLNKNLTGADQTLFIDDDDSSGYLGTAGQMKTLSVSVTANDKMVFQNFSGATFGSAASGQWYTELDLNGWATPTTVAVVDQGFGDFNVWKAAAINPNIAVSGGANQVGIDDRSGRTLTHMKFDDAGNKLYSGGVGYAGPANLGYTLADSSSTRISFTLSNITITSGANSFTMSKNWTVYPTGRIFGRYILSGATPGFNMGDPNLELQSRYNSGVVKSWVWNYADDNWRYGLMGGDLDFHSSAIALLRLKAEGSNQADPLDAGTNSTLESNSGGADHRAARLGLQNGQFEAADMNTTPITVAFMVDISRDFTDSATADSLLKDVQTPAAITAITGTATTTDPLDYNTDSFAEGDGAYTYQASGGIAHFRFVSTVTHFNPAFRVGTWTQGVLPEIVILDNQILTRGYGYNAYLNTAGANGGEVILQFNKTITPGTHVVFISHKSGLAVTLRSFEAKGGDGADTLDWVTESEFENLGYHLYRRVAPGQLDSALAEGRDVAGAGIANALMNAARAEAAAKAAARLSKSQAALPASGDSALDTVPRQNLSAEELAALGFVRITPKLIPGAKGGSASSTQKYRFIDRTAAFGVAYEYMLEAVDFNGNRDLFGPRTARPSNPLTTELQSNYPNPFNPITTLRFSLKDKLKVSLIIYDSKGRLVRTLVRPDRAMLPGKYRLTWDARDEGGFEVPSGQYYYRFTAAKYVKTRKMILVK